MRIESNSLVGAQEPISSITGLELVKAKHTIEQFIYSCSHTLRGPLKSIAGLVHLLKNSETHKEIDPKVFLQAIEKTVGKMELVLNELEQFLSNSRQVLTAQAIEVKSVLEAVIKDLQPLGLQDGIAISIESRQTVPFFTDKNRLQVILMHLISNAIQFRDASKSKTEINIQVKVTTASCSIQIQDNGIGIKPTVLPNIFQLFYRGSENSTGSGVGLYIVKEVLSKMGGAIMVQSQESNGSTFHISMPNLVA